MVFGLSSFSYFYITLGKSFIKREQMVEQRFTCVNTPERVHSQASWTKRIVIRWLLPGYKAKKDCKSSAIQQSWEGQGFRDAALKARWVQRWAPHLLHESFRSDPQNVDSSTLGIEKEVQSSWISQTPCFLQTCKAPIHSFSVKPWVPLWQEYHCTLQSSQGRENCLSHRNCLIDRCWR